MLVSLLQRCPECHHMFYGTDAIGKPCLLCEMARYRRAAEKDPFYREIEGTSMNESNSDARPGADCNNCKNLLVGNTTGSPVARCEKGNEIVQIGEVTWTGPVGCPEFHLGEPRAVS